MLDRRAVIDHLREHACAPSPERPPRVGVEQEWHTFCVGDVERHVHPAEILSAASEPGRLPCGSTVTVEPGGQVELATTATDPWWACLDAVRVDGAVLRQRLSEAGIAAVPAGVDPFRPPARTLTHPRYDAMQAYFDSHGPEGRRMMSSCASIQVNVDSGDAITMAHRWDLAHRIGPALGSAFACSPDPLHRSERLANWNAMDRTRTRPVLVTGDIGADWATYVLAARVMLVRDGDGTCRPLAHSMTFGEWVDDGLDGVRPTLDDLEYHCTTLFPPVRPRGWLELRWLDALPAGVAELAIAAVAVLLIDEEAGQAAGEACTPVSAAAMWDTAAEVGPRHPGLAAAGAASLRFAAEALDRSEAPGHWAEAVAEAADRWPAKGRCPADELEDRLAAGLGPEALADPAEEVLPWGR
ncbi:MAG TPA: glutamate-cysteine ligase family protein [Acidimicrobiales bacterium]|nr:glutamate-cysteine ligase family protein [Acidimicrobiales bacterium]